MIQPARSYSSTILPVYDPVVWIKGIATVSSVFPPMKVAATVSRILTMPDNGVRRNASGYTAPVLTIHAQEGCPSIPYGTGQYGEACAGANEAWFGMSLRQVGGNANNPIYEETGWHTTHDAYTIGHELGHSMQSAAGGGPGTYDYSVIGEDMCSCDHVYDGNRVHCLQSSHRQDTAEIEGFGHFYAARVMNDQASTCRFTYYKNYREVTDWSDPKNNNDSIYPPVPINCGQPFEGFPGTTAQKQGWVPSFCPESNTSSENDWLTFLWAVNGSASTSQRSSMNDLFTILGGSGSYAGFTWTSVKNKATSHFATNPTKRNRFTDSGELHGVDQ